MNSHQEERDLNNASITTDEFCDYRQGRALAEVQRGQEVVPSQSCSRIPQDRQPIGKESEFTVELRIIFHDASFTWVGT